MRAIARVMLSVFLVAGVLLVEDESFARFQEGPYRCEVKQTSDGDFGVRELRPSGWVYIVRQLSLEEAVETLEYLKFINRCY